MNSQIIQLSIYKFCQCAELPLGVLIEIVDYGIVDPCGATQDQWRFSINELPIAKRAFRLQVELKIEWTGVVLASQLLDELEHLRAENSRLRRRFNRFEQL